MRRDPELRCGDSGIEGAARGTLTSITVTLMCMIAVVAGTVMATIGDVGIVVILGVVTETATATATSVMVAGRA